MNAIIVFTIIQLIFVISLGLFISKFRIWKPKRTAYFAGVYMLCGLLAFSYLLFASKDMDKAESSEVLMKQITMNKDMHERLKMRDFTVLKEDQLKFSKTFEPTTKDITVNRDEQLGYIPMVINWVDTEARTITASYYETPIYTNGLLMSSDVTAPAITFEDNTIFIKDTKTRVNVKTLSLSIDMLEGRWDHVTDGIIGNRILYLNVPKQFNIIDSGGLY